MEDGVRYSPRRPEGFDDEQVGGVQTLGNVARGPHDQVPLDQLLVQVGDDLIHEPA